MTNRSYRYKKELYEKSPNCYWCGEQMTLYHGVPSGEKLPDNAVTIEHIFAIKDKRRKYFKKIKTPSPVVLACNKCNNKRKGKSLVSYEEKFNKNKNGWTKYQPKRIIEICRKRGFI